MNDENIFEKLYQEYKGIQDKFWLNQKEIECQKICMKEWSEAKIDTPLKCEEKI